MCADLKKKKKIIIQINSCKFRKTQYCSTFYYTSENVYAPHNILTDYENVSIIRVRMY